MLINNFEAICGDKTLLNHFNGQNVRHIRSVAPESQMAHNEVLRYRVPTCLRQAGTRLIIF